MRKSYTVRQTVFSIMQYFLITLLCVIVLFPLFLVFVNSLKTNTEITRNPISFPSGINFDNFKRAWKMGNFSRGFLNSVKLTLTTVTIVLVSSSLAGYVLATKKLKDIGVVTSYFLLAMTVPLQLFLFPLFGILSSLKLIGSSSHVSIYVVGFILSATNMPLAVMLMRTFFMNIPLSLEEAAKIDGATSMQIFTRIMLPLISPGIITVSVITGINAWNEFLMSSTFLQGQKNFTVTLGYLSFNGVFSLDQGLMMAGALIIIIPIIIFFLSLQKYVVQGLVSGSVKG